ncbi:MAG: 2-iminoacetate synthase ThiH [Prevotellaceae bacterium]|jgi:2-iminoacetate synthase|nr:2-iminoacetate synthase ThiH [Prevotellaceae bacterium]
MFSEELQKISWHETTRAIYAKTAREVEDALSRAHAQLSVDDFMALISPAAEPYLEQMAQLGKQYTQMRFGKTISMYVPMYLSNSCTNSCVYCGFQHKNQVKRIILTDDEILAELKAIKRLAPFQNLLLVTGENPREAGVDYIERALRLAQPMFNNLSVEVMPLAAEQYRRLTEAGLYGVVCFQETYNRERYTTYHPAGMKSKFEWRVNGFDRMGQAGVHKIGMGVLIGLEEWRTDITMMAYHLRYLQRHYWQTRYSVNFPRMRPSENDSFQPNVLMSDREYVQTMLAMRLFDHDVDISVSTRENAEFRNNIIPLGVTSMSAGSKTDPGGYASYPQALEQFSVSDDRLPAEVEQAIRSAGYEVVWKDWDTALQQ